MLNEGTGTPSRNWELRRIAIRAQTGRDVLARALQVEVARRSKTRPLWCISVMTGVMDIRAGCRDRAHSPRQTTESCSHRIVIVRGANVSGTRAPVWSNSTGYSTLMSALPVCSALN